MNDNGYITIIEFKDLVVATMLQNNKTLINFDDVRITADTVQNQLNQENITGKVICSKESLHEFKRKYKDVFTVGSKSIQLNKGYGRVYLIEHFVSNLPTKTLYWLGYLADEKNIKNNI